MTRNLIPSFLLISHTCLIVKIAMNISLEEENCSLTMSSVDANTTSENYNDSLYGSTLAKAARTFLLFIQHVVGPILIFGIIAYEKKSGDPQKRNIINRLQSLLFGNMILINVILSVWKIFIEIFGLRSFSVIFWLECFINIAFFNVFLLFAEITTIQFMYFVVWKRVKEINDEFWSKYLKNTTTLMSCWLVLFEHTPPRVHSSHIKRLAANSEKPFEGLRYIDLYFHIIFSLNYSWFICNHINIFSLHLALRRGG